MKAGDCYFFFVLEIGMFDQMNNIFFAIVRITRCRSTNTLLVPVLDW